MYFWNLLLTSNVNASAGKDHWPIRKKHSVQGLPSKILPPGWGFQGRPFSAVLSGSRFVAPDLKERVLAAIEEMHYVPDFIARKLENQLHHDDWVGVAQYSQSGLGDHRPRGSPTSPVRPATAPSCTTPMSRSR